MTIEPRLMYLLSVVLGGFVPQGCCMCILYLCCLLHSLIPFIFILQLFRRTVCNRLPWFDCFYLLATFLSYWWLFFDSLLMKKCTTSILSLFCTTSVSVMFARDTPRFLPVHCYRNGVMEGERTKEVRMDCYLNSSVYITASWRRCKTVIPLCKTSSPSWTYYDDDWLR